MPKVKILFLRALIYFSCCIDLGIIFFFGVFINEFLFLISFVFSDNLIAASTSSLSIILLSFAESIRLSIIFLALSAFSPVIHNMLPLALILKSNSFSICLIFLSPSPKIKAAILLSLTSNITCFCFAITIRLLQSSYYC